MEPGEGQSQTTPSWLLGMLLNRAPKTSVSLPRLGLHVTSRVHPLFRPRVRSPPALLVYVRYTKDNGQEKLFGEISQVDGGHVLGAEALSVPNCLFPTPTPDLNPYCCLVIDYREYRCRCRRCRRRRVVFHVHRLVSYHTFF